MGSQFINKLDTSYNVPKRNAQIRAKIEVLDKRMAEIDALTKTMTDDDPRWHELISECNSITVQTNRDLRFRGEADSGYAD